MKLWLSILLGLGGTVMTNELVELGERQSVFNQAREYADSLNKPLLVVGTPKEIAAFHHPCGDVTIDINPDITSPCDYEIADVRSIPYPDQYFGAAYVSHVLEHLATADDAIQALEELDRVAYRTFVVSPHKTSLLAWLHPDHHLWVTPSGDGYIIQQRGNPPAQEDSYIVSMQVI